MYIFLVQYNSDDVSKTYVVQSALNSPINAFYSICNYLKIRPNITHKKHDDDGNVYYIDENTVVVKLLSKAWVFDSFSKIWE